MKRRNLYLQLAAGFTIMSYLGCADSFHPLKLSSPSMTNSLEKTEESAQMLEGDMIFDESQLSYEHSTMSATGYQFLKVYPWPGGKVSVVFEGASTFTAAEKATFFATCKEWSQVANVNCVEGNPKTKPFLLITKKDPNNDGQGCYSSVGMKSDSRMMLPTPACFNRNILLHELGHVFGLIHEHQRSDRDDYISINRSNANPTYLYAFDIISFAKKSANYDFLSVMHYGRNYFSANGQDTIVPKPAYANFINIMGLENQISAGDAAGMRDVYGPPKALSSKYAHNLNIYITDAQLRKLSGVAVTVGSKTVLTNLEGRAEFKAMPEGAYSIFATHTKYVPATRNIQLLSDERINLALTVIDKSSFNLSFSIRDADGRPVTNAIVVAAGRSQLTAQSGTVDFGVIKNGSYVYSVKASGFETQTDTLELNRSQDVTVTLNATNRPTSSGAFAGWYALKSVGRAGQVLQANLEILNDGSLPWSRYAIECATTNDSGGAIRFTGFSAPGASSFTPGRASTYTVNFVALPHSGTLREVRTYHFKCRLSVDDKLAAESGYISIAIRNN